MAKTIFSNDCYFNPEKNAGVKKSFDMEGFRIVEDVEVASDGRKQKVKNMVKCKSSDLKKGYKWQDFTIENLDAIGALDGLHYSTFSDGDIDAILNNVDSLMNSIDAFQATNNAAEQAEAVGE